MKKKDNISSAINTFEILTKKPETFLSVQNNITDNITTLIKSLYDFTKTEENEREKSSALPKLIVKDFDEEQIWQELELQNESVWAELVDTVSKSMCNKEKLNFPVDIGSDEKENNNGEEQEAMEEEQEEEEVQTPKSSLKAKSTRKKMKKSSRKNTSIVDDEFFKLKEMEQFLDMEDKKVAEKKKSKNLNEESDDDSINLFEDIDSIDSDEEGVDETQVKYKDFFDNDDEEENGEEKDDSEEGSLSDNDDEKKQNDSGNDANNEYLDKMKKKVRFHMDGVDDESDFGKEDNGLNENEESSVLNKPAEPLSEYELRQQRLQQRIEKLENKNLAEKSWQMKGEIDASGRPQNSLLEEVVDFDLTTRPAPLISEETTFKLEDIIKQRIKDKVWDDVERKAKPTEEPQEFKKKLILDQEKSKLSLAQVYEREYIKQRNLLNPDFDEVQDEPIQHKNIKQLMATLFGKLDALSNYHYTPKTATPEVKIISNIPAINLEEVAPVVTSDAALLAPEEIKAKKKSELMSKSERTTTDKKRERRKKKIHQKLKQKQKEAKSISSSKLEDKSKSLEKLIKDTNIEKMVKLDDKSLKSSKSFFTQLQDVAHSKKNKPNKHNRVMLPAKKYKL